MADYKAKDNAYSTLAVGISDVATSFSVQTGHGDRFSEVVAPDYSYVTFENAAGDIEKMLVTARASGADTFTVTRGQAGTTARAWLAGDAIECRPLASLMETAINNRQPLDAALTALAALTTAANKLTYSTASDTFATTDLTEAGRDLLGGADAEAQRTTLGVEPAPFGKKKATTTGLTFGYFGGQMLVDGVLTTIAAGTVALTAASTNYVEATRAGVVSKNTTGFTAGQIPLYEITTDGAAITATLDRRIGNSPPTGLLSLSVAGSGDTTLTAAQARNNILVLTGILTGARNVIVPAEADSWTVYNNTSGAFALTVKTASGTGVTILTGAHAEVYSNGTNVVASDLSAGGEVGGTLKMNGAAFNESVGASIASASTINLTTATGNLVHITGSTQINAVTIGAGMCRTVIFDGALALAHHATNNNLPGAANITTAAGDRAVYWGDGTTSYCTSYTTASSQSGESAGMIKDFGGTSAPTGYLVCDGSAVSRATYAALFSAISTTWGAGDGSTTFNLPNLSRRATVGSGGSGTATLANSVGSIGGAETHALTVDELAAHSHSIAAANATGGSISEVTKTGANSAPVGCSTNSAGGNGAHNNMQPSAVVLKIIKT